MGLGLKVILKYALTPQLMPRIQSLFFSGFSYVAFFMAQTYRAVRLLPQGHPYLNPANAGRFGIRHVLAEAGNNLRFRRENIDQIVIYIMMILGIILLIAQLFMLLVSGFVEIAHAGALTYPSSNPLYFFTYFRTPDATHELAFVLLDRVFGIPGAAGPGSSFFADVGGGYTCVVNGERCFDLGQSSRWDNAADQDGIDRYVATNYARSNFEDINFPWPYHEALRGMLQLYSVGLLVIGVFIFLYFIFALAAETAQTGTAFGRRFNHIWAPLRIVIAMGLLVPITYGLNPAQWILMFSAKWGSSFATNGWILYNEALTSEETLLGSQKTLVASVNAPPVNTLMEFGSILATCKTAYEKVMHERTVSGRPAVEIDAWLVNPHSTAKPKKLVETDFIQAYDYFNKGAIHVRFGELREEKHQAWDGRVAPFCGEIVQDIVYTPEDGQTTISSMTEPGSYQMQFIYYTLIRAIWADIVGKSDDSTFSPPITFREIGKTMTNLYVAQNREDSSAKQPSSEELSGLREAYQDYIDHWIAISVVDQQKSGEWQEELTALGWGGAAIWYNKVAQLNGGLVSAVYAMPRVKKYPWIMEKTRTDRAGNVSNMSGKSRHENYTGKEDNPMDAGDENNIDISNALFETQKIWNDSYSDQTPEGNIFIDSINMIFGTEGLFDIVSNDANNIHPLAQLASIGRTIIDSAIRNMGASAVAGLSGGIINLFQQHQVGAFAGTAASFLFQVAMIGLSVGFVLFYIIPFLPFIYFFFAVGGWIKAIFEAMVGVPLWALAHIRIDGNGLPGDAAMGGYFLILEIFLRPILIIFGFIASITIFTAQVQILHEVWSMVVSSVSGFDPDNPQIDQAGESGSIEFLRGAVDDFFYTIMYAIICYMLAMGSFKLIDQIPNNILRWMGASVSTFGDQNEQPAENLVRNSFIASNMIGGPLKQAAGSASQAGKQSGAAIAGLFGRSAK